MANYSKPPMNSIPFQFTTGGYQKPDFENVPFQWRATYQQTADLQAAITVVVLGGQADLPSFIRPSIQQFKNLGGYAYGIPPLDLSAYIHGFDRSTKNISASLYGWQPKDLSAIIGAHSPADLQAVLDIIEIRNLPASIIGEWYHGVKNLGAGIHKVFLRGYDNLLAVLHGWQLEDLSAYINAVFFADLAALIQSTTVSDLGGLIYSIAPIDLFASIHGFDTKNLLASLIGGYGPYDLQAYLNPIPAQNLAAYIRGWKGFQVPFDLPAFLSGWQTWDLSASIGAISAVELRAYLNAIGKAVDLAATIIPRTIRMKRALKIALLEHIDLAATINFQCFASRFEDLGAYLYPIYKKDLTAFIWGWHSLDGYKNLSAGINTTNYWVQDIYIPKFVPEVEKYTQLKVTFSATGEAYKTFNTLAILFGSYYSADLMASIIGTLTSEDLGASITPILQANYTELPDYVFPKRHEVVIDFDDNWRENWRRFVEIMFKKDGAEPLHYFYVSGNQQVYRLDRSRHWTIWADSYQRDENNVVEKRDIRRKYIFRMSDYNNIDEAIRDLIDRVSTFRTANLAAFITPIIDKRSDLSAFIEVRRSARTWVKHLRASITGVP